MDGRRSFLRTDAHLTCTPRKQVQTAMSGARKRICLRKNSPIACDANTQVQTELTMSEPSKTIAVRVPVELLNEIEELTKEAGQTKSDWIRDTIMAAIHGAAPTAASSPAIQSETDSIRLVLDAIEGKIKQRDEELLNELVSIRLAVNQAAKVLHDDFFQMAHATKEFEASISDWLGYAFSEILSAVRLRQQPSSNRADNNHRHQSHRRRGGY